MSWWWRRQAQMTAKRSFGLWWVFFLNLSSFLITNTVFVLLQPYSDYVSDVRAGDGEDGPKRPRNGRLDFLWVSGQPSHHWSFLMHLRRPPLQSELTRAQSKANDGQQWPTRTNYKEVHVIFFFTYLRLHSGETPPSKAYDSQWWPTRTYNRWLLWRQRQPRWLQRPE